MSPTQILDCFLFFFNGIPHHALCTLVANTHRTKFKASLVRHALEPSLSPLFQSISFLFLARQHTTVLQAF